VGIHLYRIISRVPYTEDYRWGFLEATRSTKLALTQNIQFVAALKQED